MRVMRAVVVAGALVVSVSAVPAQAAANKEHQQLMAEIRMLQEQQQQLQQLLGNLTALLRDDGGVEAEKHIAEAGRLTSVTAILGRQRPPAAS